MKRCWRNPKSSGASNREESAPKKANLFFPNFFTPEVLEGEEERMQALAFAGPPPTTPHVSATAATSRPKLLYREVAVADNSDPTTLKFWPHLTWPHGSL